MSLAEIRAVLAGGGDPRELIRRQLAEVEQRIAVAFRLRLDLRAVLRALDEAAEPSATTLIDVIEGMITMHRPLSPEQLQELNEHRRRMTETLSEAELAELAERRRQYHEQLTPDELAELQRRRLALLPPES
ncbi:hypothetical protein [Dactylosporangium sp. CA-092794]|uniref:hypothetical protein n=1 Tax=Dactylosporangium sp. CA-092794 TaxID=3239929 RepID=UPI003D903341